MSIHEGEQGLIQRTIARVNQHKTELAMAAVLGVGGVACSDNDSDESKIGELDTSVEVLAECDVTPAGLDELKDLIDGPGPFDANEAATNPEATDQEILEEAARDL